MISSLKEKDFIAHSVLVNRLGYAVVKKTHINLKIAVASNTNVYSLLAQVEISAC